MKYNFCFFLIILLNMSCTQQESTNSEPPQKVTMVHRISGCDTTASEAGIDAVPDPDSNSNHIQLMWYNHPELQDISHFNIYRSHHETGKANYQIIASKVPDQPGIIDTIFVDTQDLSLNVRYYYYLTAVDDENRESNNSDTLSYRLIEKAKRLSINSNATVVTNPSINFEWWMESGRTPDLYILRIEQFINEKFHPLVYRGYIQSNYQGYQTFRLEGDWLKDRLENSKYRWRIDCVGEENIFEKYYSGSESDWAVFTVSWSD